MINIELQTLTQNLNEFEKQIDIMIGSRLRKEVTNLKSEFINDIFKGHIKRFEVEEMIQSTPFSNIIDKVDNVYFQKELNLKSNRCDLEMSMQSIDIIHKQMKAIMGEIFLNLQHCLLSHQSKK